MEVINDMINEFRWITGGNVTDCCCRCEPGSSRSPVVVVRLSISPGSFLVVVVFFELSGAVKEVGEIGRDGDPYSLKIPSPVRICMVSRKWRDGRGWKIEGGDGGFADIGQSKGFLPA